MTKMTKKIFQKKKDCPKKEFHKKSIKNYQKLNKEQNDHRQTNQPTNRHSGLQSRVARD